MLHLEGRIYDEVLFLSYLDLNIFELLVNIVFLLLEYIFVRH